MTALQNQKPKSMNQKIFSIKKSKHFFCRKDSVLLFTKIVSVRWLQR
jgi:hypothetical protein